MAPVTHSLVLLGFTACLTLNAQADPGALPSASYQASCNAWGTPAKCTSDWSEGLSPELRVQDYRIAHAETGKTIFAGRGVYSVADGKVSGYWEDSQGSIHRLTGSWTDNVLEVIWGETDAPIGKSRYDFSGSGMKAEDWSHTDAGWQSFMVIRYPD